MKRMFFIIACVFFVMIPHSFAQDFSLGDDTISISLTPEHPKRGEHFIAEIQTTSFDANRAVITWSIDGKVVSKGTGAKKLDGGVAKSGNTSIKVLVSNAGVQIEKTILFNPDLVSIAWEAHSYVPPFYKGKALFPPQGHVTFSALTSFKDSSGNLIPPSKLIYTWKRDDIFYADLSGVGQNTFEYKSPVIDHPFDIEVEVENPATGERGNASLSIETNEPETLLYESDPLFGIHFEKALTDTLTLKNSEISLFAVPYFMNLASFYSLDLNWFMNGESISNSFNQEITLRTQKKTAGTSNITLSVINPEKILQQNKVELSLVYKGSDEVVQKDVFNQ